MESSSINTTSERFFDKLPQRFNFNKEQKYFSGVDQEFEELFAEILGRRNKVSIYISKNIEEDSGKILRIKKGDTFSS